jgi:hypothetical protein
MAKIRKYSQAKGQHLGLVRLTELASDLLDRIRLFNSGLGRQELQLNALWNNRPPYLVAAWDQVSTSSAFQTGQWSPIEFRNEVLHDNEVRIKTINSQPRTQFAPDMPGDYWIYCKFEYDVPSVTNITRIHLALFKNEVLYKVIDTLYAPGTEGILKGGKLFAAGLGDRFDLRIKPVGEALQTFTLIDAYVDIAWQGHRHDEEGNPPNNSWT